MTCYPFPLLPTPSANFHEQEPEVFLARRERERMKGRNGNGFGLTLGMAVQLLPTPTAHDDGKSPEAHMRMKRRMPGGARTTITSLSVLARAGFEQPPSAPGSVDSTSPSTPQSEPCQPGSANPTRTVEPCSSGTGPEWTCCPTCGKSTLDSDPWTCCTPATPASRSRRQDDDSARTTPGICGPPSGTPFAFYDPEQSCWRTSQGTFDWDSTPSSVTLPAWGSLHGGALYEQPTWEPRTDGHGSLSLPTPISWDWKGGNTSGDSLPDAVAMSQTPSVADAMGGHLSRGGARSHELLLKGQVKALLPTPGANDMTGGEGPTREARQESGTGGPALRDIGHLLPTPMSATYEQGGDGRELRAAIQHGPGRRLLPTPTSMDSKASGGSTPSDVTLTDAVVRTSLGASTNPRFDAGNESSDEPPPGQLTIEDA